MPTALTSSSYSNSASSWLNEKTALAQRELVTRQLAREGTCLPFMEFYRLMDELKWRSPRVRVGATLLDVGCGVGHYGVLTQRRYPQLRYMGTDVSPFMLQHSLVPHATLRCCAYEDNDFGAQEVVLLSQVLEMLEFPEAALAWTLSQLQSGTWVVFHRLRHDPRGPYAVEETTYLNQPARNYVWNLARLRSALGAVGAVYMENHWEDHASLLFEKS